ncbi:hypothetical protein N9K60_02155 [Candidatus Poseidoniales archaeon]|nr:hypothetical protein [Candidatus Poseidoniales archaeon]
MALPKKAAAQLLIDALTSEKKLKGRVIAVIIQSILIAIVVTYLTSWYFGLACILVFSLLGQFAHERMTNSITVRKITAIKSLRWNETELENPELLNKLSKILE